MPTRPTRKPATFRRTILRVTELERRDTPAWWSVVAPSPAEGTIGSTDATHAGGLGFSPEFTPANGAVTVWADTATEAAAKALAGTITVTLLGQSVDYAFGPDTVGTSAADHKAFLAVASGSGVALGFEDMAGLAGCDYDYDDRTWAGVSVVGAGDPVVARLDSQVWWAAQDPGAYATVTSVVSQTVVGGEAAYKWWYEVTNTSVDWVSTYSNPESPPTGLAGVSIGGPETDYTTPLGSPQNDWGWDGHLGSFSNNGYGDGAHWLSPTLGEGGDYIPVGGVGHFWYFTKPIPVVAGGGEFFSPSLAGGGGGPALAPALAKADITIDGDLTVGAANPEIPGSKSVVTQFSPKNDTNEDTIGGLVVRKADINNVDDNKAPRQQITIQKLKDAAGNPAVGGQVTLTVPGQVKLFDVATKGSSVATGTVFDQTALPKKLWVEGAVGSTTMRDAKIKATPVGNPAGADDVSFTVLWVDVVVATSKYISDNNDKRDNYIAATELGTGKLGLQKYSVGPRMEWGTEARGAVSPANFDYPGGDLHLGRDVEYYIYNDTKELDKPDHFSQVIPAGNDTSKPWIRDDNPVDSGGFIYDYDALGLVMNEQVNGFIKRVRSNIRAFAAITIDSIPVRPSGIYAYSIRFSMKQTGPNPGNDWSIISPADVPGDNAVLVGPETTKTTWNLQ